MSTPVIGRRLAASLGASAVVLMTVGVPAASAGQSAVTDPMAVPAPGFAASGVRTDACDATTVPGWIGTGTPALTAHTTAPGARFKVWDAAGQKVLDEHADTAADGTVQVRPTGLADAAGYSWQVWPEYSPGSGKPTEACHFGVDTVAPQLTVASTDFPASDSGLTPQKYAGQVGAFTLRGTDQGSGTACFRYVLNGTPSTAAGCEGSVPAGSDGTATVAIRPTQWGTNVLTVQAVDNAGNTAQPVSYTFYAPWNPNPPQAPGDVDGDAVPDILLPDTAGNLQIISAAANGTTPTSVVSAAAAPGGAGWTGYQVAHRGWDNHEPVDDLFVHAAGNDYLYLYKNTALGAFDGSGAVLVPRPTACATAGCAATWAAADQVVSLGAIGAGTRPSLLTVENGDLWLFTDPGFASRFRTVKRLSTTGAWAGYDVVAPGAAADGSLALWAREKATGTLRAYQLPKGADGTYDFSALVDPATGAVIGTFPVADYPTLGSSGDGDGDGQPDLYAVTADRHLVTFHGATAPKDRGTLR